MDKETRKEFRKIDKKFAKIDERFEKIDERFEQIDERFEKIENSLSHCVTKIEFHAAIDDLKENMMTKSDYNVLMDMLEQMLPEFQTCQRNNILTGSRLCDMDDKIANHENRLRVLES